MKIFDKLFKKNKEIEAIEEKVNDITPEQNKDNEVKEVLSYEEMLESDKLSINILSDQFVIIGGVLNFTCETFSNSINLTKEEDYPLIKMTKIKKEDKLLSDWEKGSLNKNMEFVSRVDNFFNWAFYTHEGAILFIKKYYEIREKHLKELFPVK